MCPGKMCRRRAKFNGRGTACGPRRLLPGYPEEPGTAFVDARPERAHFDARILDALHRRRREKRGHITRAKGIRTFSQYVALESRRRRRESVRAATQIAPMMGLLDTWALALQMRAFLAEGNTGGSLFGPHQEAVRWVAEVQAQNADALAERIIAPKDYEKYHGFVETYVRRYPLQDLTSSGPPSSSCGAAKAERKSNWSILWARYLKPCRTLPTE